MKLQRLASPLAIGLLALAVPLLTGANGKGCGGGDVVVGGDAGSGSGNTCTQDSDCKVQDLSCLICADGSCAPTVCVEGTCQKACSEPQPQCSTDSDCAVQPDICELCADGTCAAYGCHSNVCAFECPAPPGGECNVAADCPGVGACPPCADGSCANVDCVGGKCAFTCPPQDYSCAGNELFLKLDGDGPTEQTYSYSDCPSNDVPSGNVESYLVHYADGTVGLAVRSCSGQTAWLTLGGDAAAMYPASLTNARYDYVGPDGVEHNAAAAMELHISFFGDVGQIVDGKFVVQDIPGSLDSITGYFRACRSADLYAP